MKRILITIVAIVALTLPMNAQRFRFSEAADLAFGNRTFFVEPISYLGFGWHLFNNEMATEQNAYNSEFFVNIMELGIRPASGFMIALGVDYKLDQYRLNSSYLWGSETGSSAWIRPLDMSPYKSVKFSRLNVNTFSVPLSFEFRTWKCAFRIGAAGEYNLPGVNKNKLVKPDGTTETHKVTGIPVKEFNYSFFGAISYGGIGVFVRYRPTYQFTKDSNGLLGPQFKSLSIGAVIGLGM